MPEDDTRQKIEAARDRRNAGEAEVAEAKTELSRLFSYVIQEGLDLKAMAKLAGVSRQTAYNLASDYDVKRR
jgi:uncharacterized Rmd1/YagE family protein